MYLKALEIHGFKSFPDRTRLTFMKGLTAVVGPNGSGKSNISDAMRWVLGEQSTKILRGSKMEDVIFGGTQQRKAMGFAQVTLYIDNTDRSIDIESDEVTVTRKLYRSGDSEYKINNQNVRLRDVYELFMDTGLGRDGYSMIGQGKIAEIVGAKSQNRREIFEEAAGISKFRYRKTEAERKLTAAEENLLRLRDIMVELEDRVGPLKIQAQKASQFVKYAQEKKKLEISIWNDQLESIKGQIRRQDDQVLSSREAHQAAQEQLAEIEREVQAAFEQAAGCTMAIEELRSQMHSREEETARAQAQMAVLENDISHNQQSIERIVGEISQQHLSGLDIETQIQRQQQQAQELSGRLSSVSGRLSALCTQWEAASQQELAEGEQTERQRRKLSELTMALSEAKVAAITAQSSCNEIKNRIEMLRRSQEEKEQREADLRTERQDCLELIDGIEESLKGLQNSLQGVGLKVQKRLQRREELERELRSVEAKAKEKQQRAYILEGLEQAMEGFSGSVKFVLKAKKQGALNGVHSAISKLIEVDAAHTVAIETALGAALQNIVVQDDESAKRAILLLKESKAGRATFLPLATIRGSRLREAGLEQEPGFVAIACDLVRCKPVYQPVLQSLLGRVVVAEDLNDAVTMARKYQNRFRIVTLDGQVVNIGGSLTGGSTAKSAGLLSRQSEIDRLKTAGEQILASAEGIRVQIRQTAEELAKLEAQQLALESESKSAAEDKIRYEAELKRIVMALEDLSRDKLDSQGQQRLMEQKLASFQKEIAGAGDRLVQLQGEQSEAERQVAQSLQETALLRRQREKLAAQKNELEMQSLALTKDLQGLEQTMQEMRQRKEDQSLRVEEYQKQIQQLNLQNGEIKERIQSLHEDMRQAAQQSADAQREVALLQERRQQYERRSTEIRAQEKEILARREQLARELARVEERKLSLQSEYDSVVARMWDEYEMTRSEAQALAEPIENLPQAQRALGEIKAQIKALGTVNLEAIDEYEQVSKRYEFMKEQIDDVEKSRDQLNKIIFDLTAQMREMFADSFRRINGQFGIIFAELFGGGQAQLLLTESPDVLEAGIEIRVQPPGKLIKNLASLSGGEQAFVAIAIYFAILKVRPAPFCLLDEIEAALDDVNVAKYAQFLKRLSDRTQFITITHRRGTMEEADVLYGVTMQEEGVSKLLELAVSELESKLGMKMENS